MVLFVFILSLQKDDIQAILCFQSNIPLNARSSYIYIINTYFNIQ